MDISKIDLRSEFLRQRDERNSKVCAEWVEMHRQMPHAKPFAVFAYIGKRYGLSNMSVYRIIKQHGLYQSRAMKAEREKDDK